MRFGSGVAIATALIAAAATIPAVAADVPLAGANSGKATILRRGQAAVVELQTNASTGYTWKVDAEAGIQVTLASTMPTRPGMVGAPSVATYRITGTKRGTYRIVFRYLRPWENKAVRTLTYRVRIT